MLASLLRIILLTATLKILERGLDKGPIIANLRDIRVNPDGYKDWYTMLQDVHIDATYCHVRKYFFNCITPEKKSQQYRAAYRKAFDMYYQLELRWILDEQQATKLYNIFEHRVLT